GKPDRPLGQGGPGQDDQPGHQRAAQQRLHGLFSSCVSRASAVIVARAPGPGKGQRSFIVSPRVNAAASSGYSPRTAGTGSSPVSGRFVLSSSVRFFPSGSGWNVTVQSMRTSRGASSLPGTTTFGVKVIMAWPSVVSA